jgi:hypothetical protein
MSNVRVLRSCTVARAQYGIARGVCMMLTFGRERCWEGLLGFSGWLIGFCCCSWLMRIEAQYLVGIPTYQQIEQDFVVLVQPPRVLTCCPVSIFFMQIVIE